ncbi:MAG: hypothetical protein EBS06_03275 [Proteobacteria bacterium]|nr:hypothetical protein [Pseudomonadota bacterium]
MNFFRKILLPALLLVLLSCSPSKIDSTKNKNLALEKKPSENSIPSFSKLILNPPPPQIGGDKIISFSVTDQIPLKDVLIELGRVAKIDVDLDSGISGGVVINAKNRPLKEVIDRIATLGNLRYSYQNGVLHFERDLPYSKNYFVDFLSGSQLWSDVESNISAILSDGSSNSSPSNSSSSSDSSSENVSSSVSSSRYTSNKSAGIISVYATRSQHEQVSQYLDDVYRNSSAQVLIEAKIIEVTLSKEFDTGINWSWVNDAKSASTNTSFSSPSGSTASISAIVPKVKLLGLGGDLGATISALEQFGKAKSISSPRVNAINNQKATLDFTQKKIYFTVSASSSTSTGTATNTVSTVTATKNELDVGAKLEITPSINLATNEITLEVKPKLSIDTGEVAIDPSVNPSTGKSLGNTIPIINTRELSTIAKIQSGNILVIGGLISESINNNGTGIPFLMRIPFFKYIFGAFSNYTRKIETVIFIKATIVSSGNNLNKQDRSFYNKNAPEDKPEKMSKLEKVFSY